MKQGTREIPLREKQLIAIGKIVRCVGINGAIKVQPFTSSLERFSNLSSIFLGEDTASVEEYKLQAAEKRTTFVVLTFSTIVTRNDAEKLVGKYVFVDETQRISLAPREWFIDDIIGCEVIADKNIIGTVKDVLSLPSQDVWVINKNEKEIYIPAVREIIERVDVKKKIIVIHPPEGLIQVEEFEK